MDATRIDQLATVFAAESLLQIIRRREFAVWLSEDGASIQHSDEIPLWLAGALYLHRDSVISLMRADFLGTWREPTGAEI